MTTDKGRLTNLLFDFPVVNILIFFLAAGHSIQSIGDNVKIAFKARRQVNKFIAPGVFGNPALFEVSAGFPLFGDSSGFRLFHQCQKTLLRSRVDTVIKLVLF